MQQKCNQFLTNETLVNIIQPGFVLYSKPEVINRLTKINNKLNIEAFNAITNIDFSFLIWAYATYQTDSRVKQLLNTIFDTIANAYELENIFIKKLDT